MSSSEDVAREVAFFCTITIASDGFEVRSSKQFAAVGANYGEAETIVAGREVFACLYVQKVLAVEADVFSNDAHVLRYLVGQFMSSEEYRQQIPNSEATTELSFMEEIHREVRQVYSSTELSLP